MCTMTMTYEKREIASSAFGLLAMTMAGVREGSLRYDTDDECLAVRDGAEDGAGSRTRGWSGGKKNEIASSGRTPSSQ